MTSSVRIRRFLWPDLGQFTDLFNELNGIAGSEKEFDVDFMRQFLSQPSCDPERNCYVAEMGTTLVGFVLVDTELRIGRTIASGGVSRWYRNRGIGRRLLSTALAHAEGLEASVMHVQVPSGAASALHIVKSEGFRVVMTYWRMRWETDGAPSPDLPRGFELRPFKLDRDEAILTELQNAAFGGNWGFCPNTTEEISARVRLKRCDPEGIIFAMEGDRATAYAWTMRASSEAGSTGWVAMTGVRPDYRGRGLGRAVVLAGMAYLRDKGVDGVELEVAYENTAARELYQQLGFRKAAESVWYEKKLA